MADAVWTDPPYGVAYVGKTKAALTIQNDNLGLGDLTEFLRRTLGAALAVCRPGGAWYVAAPAGPAFLAFATVLTELGVWRQTISWVKNVLVMGHSDYHYRHEPVFYGHVPGAEPPALPPAEYDETTEALLYGWAPGAAHQPPPDRKQDTVWEFPKPKASRQHPTMKPVALIEKALRNSTRAGSVVLDPFGGSGSTLIACHLTGRVARLVELDPRYVDVICRRYQQHTGVVPVLVGAGAVSFIEEAVA